MKRTIAVAAILALSGCGSADYSQTQFKSIEELASVVSSVDGWSCSTSRLDDEAHASESIAKNGWAPGTCEAGALAIYGSDAKRVALAAEPYNALKPGSCRLDGGNWTVWGQQYAVQTAKARMGGTLTCA